MNADAAETGFISSVVLAAQKAQEHDAESKYMSLFAIWAAVLDTLDRRPKYIFVLTWFENGQSIKNTIFCELLVFNVESNTREIITDMSKERFVLIQ